MSEKILIPGQVIPRRGVLYSALNGIDGYDDSEGYGYRDINIEVLIKHNLGTIRFICEKRHLTEEEIKANKEAEEKGMGHEYRRGDKPYLVVGMIHEPERTYSLAGTFALASDIAGLFFAIEKSYRENPDKTTPAYLIVKSIQDMDQYSISNPLYSVPGVRFADLFQVVEYYWNEEKEKG